jgi:hypothetical protein
LSARFVRRDVPGRADGRLRNQRSFVYHRRTMKTTSAAAIVCLAGAFLSIGSAALGQERALAAGAVVSGEIRGGAAHDYRLDVRSGEAVDVRVTQKGIDLVLVVLDDTGAVIAEVDSPNGTQGDEPASFVAGRTGAYRIRVTPRGERDGLGAYEVRAQTRAATPRDHELAAVHGAFAAARRLMTTGVERDATAAAIELKTAMRRAHALGEPGLALQMAAFAGDRQPRVLFDALGVQSIPGALPLYASRGFETRARVLRDQLALALDFFEARLKIRPTVSLAVLARDDWQSAFENYGMPFSFPTAAPFVVMPAEHTLFDALAAPMRAQGLPSGATARAVARTGLSLEQGLNLAADDILFHELGHVLAGRYGLAQPNRWYGEFLAGYFAQAFLAEASRDPRVPAFSDALREWSAVQKPTYTTLEDFERLYSGVGNENYGWYQGQFEIRAAEVLKAHGLGFLARVKTAFPEGTPQTLPVSEVLARLETVAPGFQAWARALAERKPR